ncbi:helix-turn-helix domain-containing protein [Feifania hominis]|uniref:Helix-turn-helix transcriptional regulator n=1 Tax=Feifania hominis TaxID=2763660 RepID=A0A926HUB4_9FIRM|nr:helix-turn-helix transcriptional regulator [Feifania hominis]MBC8535371.1 helix-turn-helix transcriptional regulator [Feifania hominis]
MLKEKLSRNLRKLRSSMNLTQETAAELCDLSPRFWGKLERCEATPSVDTLEKISLGLQVSLEALFEEDEVGGANER